MNIQDITDLKTIEEALDMLLWERKATLRNPSRVQALLSQASKEIKEKMDTLTEKKKLSTISAEVQKHA